VPWLRYTQAIEISPQFVSLRMKRAACYDATGQYGQAVGDVSRAVKLKSGNVEGFFLLARMHFKTGDRASQHISLCHISVKFWFGLKRQRDCLIAFAFASADPSVSSSIVASVSSSIVAKVLGREGRNALASLGRKL
jgi:hypothetical protein